MSSLIRHPALWAMILCGATAIHPHNSIAGDPTVAFDVDRSGSTPDISQRGFSNPNHCAPCATANGLVWLDAQVASRVLATDHRDALTSPEAATALVTLLSTDQYMETSRRNGTNRYRLINGLWRYARPQAVGLQIGYTGVRPLKLDQLDTDVRPNVAVQQSAPQFSDVVSALRSDACVLILFGSYRRVDSSDTYCRLGGHYVCVVGYRDGMDGKKTGRAILLHDSNDGQMGRKIVTPQPIETNIELQQNGSALFRGKQVWQLVNAPIIQDGRVAFLETILTFGAKPR